jgi:asparagine synthase (glutamine-hydrolysing)
MALMARASADPITAFSIGFNEDAFDETRFARQVAQRYHAHHIVERMDGTESSLAERLPAIFDEPFGDSSALPSSLLMQLARKSVTVALSGDGGDELFAGYDFYRYLGRLDPARALLPRWLASGVLSPAADLTARALSGFGRPGLDLAARQLEWAGSLHDPARHYLLLRNAWDFNPVLLRRVYTREFREHLGVRCRDAFGDYFPDSRPVESEALRAEFGTKLVNDLLHNEDTMSMAHSVESRVPLLDLELVRFAARIPDRIRFGRGMKGLLKEALKGVLPEETLARKKWGFTVDPVEQYRKDLRPLALEWLSPERLKRGGIFEPNFVRSILAARPHQRLRWHYFMLWQMIGLEMWRDLFLGHGPGLPGSPLAGVSAARAR